MQAHLMGEETAGGLQVRTRSGDWIDASDTDDYGSGVVIEEAWAAVGGYLNYESNVHQL